MRRARLFSPETPNARLANAIRATVLAVGSIAALGLGGCVPTELDRTMRPTNDYVAEQVRLTRHLPYLPGTLALSPTGEAQLDVFLAQVGPLPEDVVTVVGYGPLGDQRASGVALALQTRGVTSVQRVNAPTPRDVVTVSVLRSFYQASACHQSADVREAAGGARLPSPGCPTASNLARMIAEPSDLVRGRPSTPSEAGPTAAAVQRYRAGQITPLIEETTTE